MRAIRFVILMCACLAAGRPAGAQGVMAFVEGTVRSASGAGLPDVIVTALNQDTGFRRSATTGPDGVYRILSLPVGAYDIRAERADFAAVVRQRVGVNADENVAIDFVLTRSASETVTVSAVAPLTDRDKATVQQTVNERLVRALPLFGRDFIQLASLAAGFTGNRNFPSPQGQRYWANNVLVDGASHFSKWRGAARTFYSGYGLESIEEVQVFTNIFSPEFGEALGSITSAVTKAGTNQWHGSALLFVRDDALDALPAFATRTPPAGAQQYGLSFGGPLVRDRTHVWASLEGRRTRDRTIVVSPAAPNTLAPDEQDEQLAFFRVDHQQSGRQLLTARYNGQFFRWHHEPGGLTLPGTGTQFTNIAHTGLVTDALQLSDRTLNELRVQFARFVDRREDLQPTVLVSRAGYSLSGGTFGSAGFGVDPEDTWEAADTLSQWRGAHAMKAGGGLKYVRAHSAALGYGRGAYFFAGSPDRYPQPFLFLQGVAPTVDAALADPRSQSAFGFLEDNWKVRSGLTLNLGVRYDIERVFNVRGYDVPVDRNNLQPRVGAAWDMRGDGRTVVRGGVGVYTQQHLLYPITRVELEGADGVRAIALGPESPLMPVFPSTLPASIVSGALLPPRDVYRVDSTFRNPYSIQSSVGVQHLLHGIVLGADVVHLRGYDLVSLVDTNAPASNSKPSQRTVAQADATRPSLPLPGSYREFLTLGNQGRSWYRALQVKASRTAGAWQTVASYTRSHAEDMANDELPEDSRNIPAEKARASTDITHNLSVGATWDLPGARPLLRGWSLSSVGAFQSNRPYTITWGDDRNGTTQGDARPGGRNTGKTGPYRNIDLALTRRFRTGKAVTEGRLEAFNVLNATNYDRYVGELLSPLYARPVTAFPQRRLQFAAIVRF